MIYNPPKNATTQSPMDGSTLIATDAYVDNMFKGAGLAGFRDDFINGFALASITSDTILYGDTLWNVHDLVVAGSSSVAAGTFNNPGQLTLTTGATGTGDGVGMSKSNSSNCVGALGSNAGWEMNIILSLSQTANCAFRVGASDGYVTDAPSNGMWCEYDSANASSNADFTFVTSSAGTRSYAITNSKAVDTNFHHIRIRSLSAGVIGFTIDGGTEFTTSTDVPTVSLTPFVQILTRTALAASIVVDFFSYMAAPART